MSFIGKTASVFGVVGLSALATLGVVESAEAANIGKGSDYLVTPPGSSFDFGGNIGQVDFVGLPVGPGQTDTIIERKEDCIFVGGSCSIDIEMTLLSMESINSVNINGSLFDVFVGLTPNTNSTGTMTINHEFTDNNNPAPEGTFSSDFTVFFDALFTPVGAGQAFTVSDSLQLTMNGANWSHEPPPATLLVRGPLGDQAANCHDANNPLCARGDLRDFFPGAAVHLEPNGRHETKIAMVPEPTTIIGSVIALGFGSLFKKQSSRKRDK